MATLTFNSNLIAVGSSVRNSIRANYVKSKFPVLTFLGEDTRSEVTPGPLGSITTVGYRENGIRRNVRYLNRNLALVEKCYDARNGITVFFCLGVRADSSWVACEYLVRNWKALVREFDSSEFFLCLSFPLADRYLEAYPDRRITRLKLEDDRDMSCDMLATRATVGVSHSPAELGIHQSSRLLRLSRVGSGVGLGAVRALRAVKKLPQLKGIRRKQTDDPLGGLSPLLSSHGLSKAQQVLQ